MTLVMAWYAPTDRLAWVVSDSRLSLPREAGGCETLTDSGAKILDLQQRRLEAYMVPPRDVLERASLGFAFAGSSLVALQAAAAVGPLWANLLGDRMPSVEESAKHLSIFLVRYTRDVSNAQNALVRTECILIGAEPRDGSISAFRLAPEIRNNQVECVPERIDLSASLYSAGSRSVAASDFMISNQEWHRQPIQWIRSWLPKTTDSDVGGGVQIGFVSANGFAHLHDTELAESGFANAKFRGMAFEDIAYVGPCFCGLPGLA